MFLFNVVFLLMLLFSKSYCNENPFVIGGDVAKKGQFPFMVSLQSAKPGKFPTHYCGGSLISDEWVLTAAHCVIDIESDENNYYAFLGWNKLNEFLSGKYFDIQESIYKEDYDENMGTHDVGLLKLKQKVEFSDLIQPVILSREDFLTEQEYEVLLIGWGVTTPNGTVASNDLLFANLNTVDNINCNDTLFGAVTYDELCAGNEERVQCSGDSGGPLLYENKQVGIVAWSVKPCGFNGVPGVYTRVSHMLDWIQEKTGIIF